MLRFCGLALLGTTLACTDHSNDREAPRSHAGPFDAPGAKDPIPCESDADCPRRNDCGPCTPGELFTRVDAEIECRIGSCMNVSIVCSEEHVCVVGPGTKKNPNAWCRACVELRHDAATICAGKSEAKSTCEQAIGEAVESCDDAACNAARAAQSK